MTNRIIKFRAWDKKYKIMYDDEFFITPDGEFYWNDEFKESGEMLLMQFTGLLDKNGKEIYEGDIIFPNAEVICGNHFGQITIRRFFKKGKKQEEVLFHEQRDEKELKIIGNIYQNPELLTSH